MTTTDDTSIVALLEAARDRPRMYGLRTHLEAIAWLRGIADVTGRLPVVEMTEWLRDREPHFGGVAGAGWYEAVAAAAVRSEPPGDLASQYTVEEETSMIEAVLDFALSWLSRTHPG